MSQENVALVRAVFETFCRDTWESGEWLARYERRCKMLRMSVWCGPKDLQLTFREGR
jgi:hypothetical protein